MLCSYDGVEGTYQITMPMTTEAAVVGGRETYGEPKKLAQITSVVMNWYKKFREAGLILTFL